MAIEVGRLLAGLRHYRLAGSAALLVDALSADSRRVRPNTLFVALRGTATDGHAYIDAAVAAGATAIVSEREVDVPPNVALAIVPDSRVAASHIAAAFYGEPSRAMRVAGITGTNGKTTTAHLVAAVFEAAGLPCAVLGTLGTRFRDHVSALDNTTPLALELHAELARLRDAGARAVAMEVSSHALALARVNDVAFATAAFTNLTRDHLDFHVTMDAYAASKRRLFDLAPLAVLNADDPYGRLWARELRDLGRTVVTYSAAGEADADLVARDLTMRPEGTRLRVDGVWIDLALPGRFNVANALAALGIARVSGIALEHAATALANVRSVPGRMERIGGGGIEAIVDYAHTPDALANVLRAARETTRGRLFVVFGAGGDRDHGKRPQMGTVARQLADVAIVTSDNPRSEDPLTIARAVAGPGAEIIVDRTAAIAAAIERAQPGDTVVVAGKGHETYQIVGSERRHFDDREVVRAALDARAGAAAS